MDKLERRTDQHMMDISWMAGCHTRGQAC